MIPAMPSGLLWRTGFVRSQTGLFALRTGTGLGDCLAVMPAAVETALQQHSEVGAVFVTSPAITGPVADIAGIAAAASGGVKTCW